MSLRHSLGCRCCGAEDCLACFGSGTKPTTLTLALKASVAPKGAGGGEPIPPECLEKDLTVTLSNASTPGNCTYAATSMTPDREPSFYAQVGSTAAFLCGSISQIEQLPRIRNFHIFDLRCEGGAPVLRIVLRSINNPTGPKYTDATFRFSMTLASETPILLNAFVLQDVGFTTNNVPATPIVWITRIHPGCTCLQNPNVASLTNQLRPQTIAP